ncbi:MAG TPA: S8 family serine peptidase [Thermoplasmata archaeon]|nr:S8 family serine peptidase [Thermoplasmata archaeon]
MAAAERSPVREPAGGVAPALPTSDPAFREAGRAAPDMSPARVIVVTTDVGALAEAVARLSGVPLGQSRGHGYGTPLLTIPRGMVGEIRKLPSTVDVFDYVPPTKQVPDDPEARSAPRPETMNWNSTINHKAPLAWARNITGDGVKIAIVDDGVDFGHPDLQGTMARVEDPASPYYGWPIAFDPFSLAAYLRQGGDPKGTWYADTSSTDRNVTHPLKVDGKNDFWTDGSELVATDPSGDMGAADYDLVTLYVTQDAANWYIGFSSHANQTTMAFELYLNTTAVGGATSDPLGNYVVPQAGHAPEFAVYIEHNGLQPPGRYDLNDTIPAAAVYAWNPATSAWGAPEDLTGSSVDGLFAYSGYKFAQGEGFVEMALPRAFLGDPAAISLELFTVGTVPSHAQDTVYSDPNVTFPAPDWSSTPTTLASAVEVGGGYWRRTYVRSDDLTTDGRPNVQFTWPVQYIVTGTSQSGKYLFGNLPDKNFALTRLLVVDESVAGVYDTVYVDLDHNKDFQNDKALKRYGKYDTNGNWHPTTWAGAGALHDETAWADTYDPAGGVVALAWSPDARWLASGGRDHQVIVWNTTSWTPQTILNGHHGRIASVAWNGASTRLAVGYDDIGSRTQYAVDVWQAPAWTLDRSYTIHSGAVNDLTFNPAGTRIATASADGTAKVYDLATQAVLTLAHPAPVTGIAWSSTNTIATTSANGELRIWSAAGILLRAPYVYGAPLNDVAWHPGGTFLALAGQDGRIAMFEAATGNTMSDGSGHFGNPVLHVDFNPAGDALVSSSAVSARFDPSLAIWSVTNWDSFVLTDQRFGAHSTATVGYGVPAAEYSASGAQIASGGLDAVVKTWSSALVLDRVLLGHSVGSRDATRYNAGDGIADVSGGMVYFIARNETPIPYSARFLQHTAEPGLAQVLPANGTLVAFMGAMDAAASHGTLMASSIVGRGVSRYYDPANMQAPSDPQVYGIAPNAKLIAVADIYATSIFDGWWFAVEGYDGIPGTGDEAQIVANSFGFSATFEDGWDFYSRFADWISTQYSAGQTVFTVSAGNDGNGYGTVTSPGSAAGVITAGASTDFFYRKWSGLEKGSSQSYGDVVPFSGRGPTALGRPDPDILANGRMSFGASPLNLVIPSNGAVASELWSGTSLSSPLTAGILALVYQAYKKAHAAFPDAETAKSILTGGADDINYDVFSQGAGFANADRATKLAQNLDGVRATPTLWTPGTFRGREYEAFVALMSPGTSAAKSFAVRNENRTAPATALLSDSVFRRTATIGYDFVSPVNPTTFAPVDEWQAVLAASPAADLYGPGVYRVTATGMTLLAPLSETDWINADLVRITIASPQTAFDPAGDGAYDYRYMLDVYDWTETDWSTPIPDTTTFLDMNRITINHPEANIFSATVHNAPIRSHDGLVLGTRLFGTGAGGLPMHATIELFQKTDWNWLTLSAPQVAVPANGTATFTATMAVPMGTPMGTYEGAITLRTRQTATDRYTVGASGGNWIRLSRFDTQPSTVRVNGVPVLPSDLTPYPMAGLIRIATALNPGDQVEVQYDVYDHVTIPVAVSVGAAGPQIAFGGSAPGQDDLFGSWVGPGFGNGGQAGDFRFFYTDIADQGLFREGRGVKFYLDTTWALARTDVDVFAFGTGGTAALDVSAFLESRYGPYLVGRNGGGSEITSNVFTTTGGPEEIVAPRVTGGLNIIAVHAVRMNGTAPEEPVAGQSALMNVNPAEVDIVTNRLAGSRDVTLFSSVNWPGIGAVSAGPSAPERFVNLHIPQDNTEGAAFVDLLAKGSFTYRVLVQKSALIFDVHITSDAGTTERPCPDLDLGVFLDGKGPGNAPDGIAQTSEFIAYGADSDANEEVKLIKPAVDDDPDTPGIDESLVGAPYLIKVLGFNVPWSPYGTFNMDLTLVQGVGFSVSGTTDSPVPAFSVSAVTLAWNLPGSTPDGTLLGALYIGPSIAPLTLLVPIDLTIDRTPPAFSNLTIGGPGVLTDDSDPRTVNARRPTIVASFTDSSRGELDAAGVSLRIDGEDVTALAGVDIPWGPNDQQIQGLWTGTLTYVPAQDLSEGAHSVEVMIADLAGNTALLTRTLVVDTRAPALLLDGAALTFTRQAAATVSGTSEPGATVSVAGVSVDVGADGRFAIPVPLADGRNDFSLRAADWFHASVAGNEALLRLTIVRDTVAPTIRAFPSASPTASGIAEIRGRISENISATESYDPTTVTLTVNGRRTWTQADGTFSVSVALTEGPNTVSIIAVDLAGNSATTDVTVVRDSTAPLLELDAIPAATPSGAVNVSGRTEPGAIVFVNGFVVTPAADGSFSRDVTLSGGSNIIVVRAEDAAGNAAEETVLVTYVAPSGGGLSVGAWAAIAAVVGVIAGLGIALLFARGGFAFPGGAAEPAPEEMMEEEAAPEEPSPAIEEAPPAVVAPAGPSAEERVARTEDAYRSGRITREVYERNLRAMGREPEPETAPEAEVPAPVAIPTPGERAERLRVAFEQGKITRAAYEANLAKMGLAPAIEAAPTPEVGIEERRAKLDAARKAGRITEDAYRANLARLGLAPAAEPETPVAPSPPSKEEQASRLAKAYQDGRLSRPAYEANLARLGLSPPPPPPEVSAPAPDRAAMLEKAYRDGRISREAYESNLAKLGIARPPDGRRVALRRAFDEGKITRAIYARNLTAQLGVAEDPAGRALTKAFVDGKIDVDLFEKNLSRLRGP